MAKIDLEKAVQFVQACGDPILSALAALAVGKLSAAETLKTLQAYQRPDGGWTKTDKDFQGDLSVISTTWVALQWLIWLGGVKSPVLENTIAFLHNTQTEAGFWDEPEEIRQYDPPFWMLPGRYENRLWLTAAVCCKLKELDCDGEVDFAQALDFLRRGWDGTRFPVFRHTHWMAMPLLAMQNTGNDLDKEIILGCKTFLFNAIQNGEVDPGDLCAIVYASRLTGNLANDLYQLTLQSAMNNQANDGGWGSSYSEKHRPGLTVEALFVLKP